MLMSVIGVVCWWKRQRLHEQRPCFGVLTQSKLQNTSSRSCLVDRGVCIARNVCARDEAHRRQDVRELRVSTICFDCCFWCGAKIRGHPPSLPLQTGPAGRQVAIKRFQKWRKGSEFLKKFAHKRVEDVGFTQVPLKSDQEPAVAEIPQHIKDQRSDETLIFHSPRRSHQSSGFCRKTTL